MKFLTPSTSLRLRRPSFASTRQHWPGRPPVERISTLFCASTAYTRSPDAPRSPGSAPSRFAASSSSPAKGASFSLAMPTASVSWATWVSPMPPTVEAASSSTGAACLTASATAWIAATSNCI